MKKELYPIYAPSADITFIMEDTLNKNGDTIFTECVGFYYGEPTDGDARFFKGKLKADFRWLWKEEKKKQK